MATKRQRAAADSSPRRSATVPRLYDLDVRMVKDTLKNFTAAIGTSRDKRSHTFHDFPRTLTRQELENMFRSSWVSKRIVRTPADDMTREWVTLTWDDSDEDQSSTKSIEVAEKTFRLRQIVNESLTWGRLYGGAGIVIDIKGQEDWAQPLDVTKVEKDSLRALHVLDRWRLSGTGELDNDRKSPQFGMPTYYMIADQGDPRDRVHWSRIVFFGGEPLPYFLKAANAYWEDSVLQHIIEVIRDYDATMAGIASMVYEANVDIVISPRLATTLTEKNANQKLQDRYLLMAQMKSINHMMLLDGGNGTKDSIGESYQQKTTQFSGLKDVAEKFMINVCGAADIPMTRLFGQSPAGLTATGESDIRNYYDRISADQEGKLRPALEKIYDVLVRSTLGKMPENFLLEFRPLWQMSDKEQAEVEYLRAQRDQIYELQGSVAVSVISSELLETGTYRTMTQNDVNLVEKMSEQAAKLPPAGTLGRPLPGGAAAPAVGRPKEGDPAHAEPATDAAPVGAEDIIRKEEGGWSVFSENGKKRLGGPYKTKAQAIKRLAQVEYFRNAG